MPIQRTSKSNEYVQVPKAFYNELIKASRYQVKKPKEAEPTWAETAKGAIVTAGLIVASGYVISKSYEPLYNWAVSKGSDKARMLCAEKLAGTTFSNKFYLHASEAVSHLYQNCKTYLTGYGAYRMISDSPLLTTLTAVVVAKPIIDGVKAITPSQKSSTVVKVVKVAALATAVLAGIYAVGYLAGLGHGYGKCPTTFSVEYKQAITGAKDALELYVATPASSATLFQKIGNTISAVIGGNSLTDAEQAFANLPISEKTSCIFTDLAPRFQENLPSAPSSEVILEKINEYRGTAGDVVAGYGGYSIAKDFGGGYVAGLFTGWMWNTGKDYVVKPAASGVYNAVVAGGGYAANAVLAAPGFAGSVIANTLGLTSLWRAVYHG